MNTRRIVILGFMACGKTTVGEELARQLNCGFVDLDSFISSREGRTSAEIITKTARSHFENWRHSRFVTSFKPAGARDCFRRRHVGEASQPHDCCAL